ncbi:hypothetical protein [Pseudoalteromonas sp. T1lg23B]|uniref:hypothetical protein n=1 Tax=Pseudoalteromonas sp. T1lg23B TaxID=2077097 RepID=UPI000CF6FED3|nr:hypothetical protein [Pseudoalteromonas sp. T1lg23B]
MKKIILSLLCIAPAAYAITDDPKSDIFNVYKYLRDSQGNCVTQEPLSKNRCESKTTAVTKNTEVFGYLGHVWGTKARKGSNSHVNDDFGGSQDLDLDGIDDSITKYSGPVSTYTAKHYPVAVKSGSYTYFVYSGPFTPDINGGRPSESEIAMATVQTPYSMGDINGSINSAAGINKGDSPFGHAYYLSSGTYTPNKARCYFSTTNYLGSFYDPNTPDNYYETEYKNHLSNQFDPDGDIQCNRSNALGIYVGKYNHVTKKVSRPVLVHAKYTDDPHDNAVINVDEDNNILIVVAARGPRRGAIMYRTKVAGDIKSFEDVTPDNFDYASVLNQTAGKTLFEKNSKQYRGMAYPKLFALPNSSNKYRIIYNVYCKGRYGDQTPVINHISCNRPSGGYQARQLHTAVLQYDTFTRKMVVSDHQTIAAYGGHYAIAKAKGNVISLAFNLHKNAHGDDRINLYHIFSEDGGYNWQYIDRFGNRKALALPLTAISDFTKAEVFKDHDIDYSNSETVITRTYMKDIDVYVENGSLKKVYILTVKSCDSSTLTACTNGQGYLPTTQPIHSMHRSFFNGVSWSTTKLTDNVDHNYSTGMVSRSLDGKRYDVFYPRTIDSRNNALAGGYVSRVTEYITAISSSKSFLEVNIASREPYKKDYYKNLCEFNYMRSVLHGSDDIIGIFSGANPYRFEPSTVNKNMAASPLFFLSRSGDIKRLPTYIPNNASEASLELVDGDHYISCKVDF